MYCRICSSDQMLDVPITCATRHRPLGMMQVGYQIVHPLRCVTLDISLSYTRYWNDKWIGLEVNMAKSSGLVLFCWRDDNNSKDTIKLLKNLGFHSIIDDKMDVLTSKEVEKSVFLLQAKESQKEMLTLQALEMGKM